MIKKPNKLIQYVSIALGAVLACGVFMSSTNFSLSNVLRSRASETITSSILFSKSTGSSYKIDGETFSVSGKSATGATYYAIAHNSSDVYDGFLKIKFGDVNVLIHFYLP